MCVCPPLPSLILFPASKLIIHNLISISDQSCRPGDELDAGQVAAELLEHHQQVAAGVEPGARDMVVPLRDVAAAGLALGLAVRPRVAAAAAAAAGGLVRPVPADVVAVHPRLALPHAAHVQGHRRVAGRRVEVGLKTITASQPASQSHTRVWFQKCRDHHACSRPLTLCHVKGCFPAALPHSTDELPATECTPSDSPCRPICVRREISQSVSQCVCVCLQTSE